MTDQEVHDRRTAAIDRQIEEAHKKLRQKADDTLKSISENYQSALMEKIGEELELSKQALKAGNSRQADMHKLRADVYRSALDAIKRGDELRKWKTQRHSIG